MLGITLRPFDDTLNPRNAVNKFFLNNISPIICGLLMLLFSSCNNLSNQKVENHIDSANIGKIRKVLILGNSIVRHPPKPDIGWNNDWGMAASAKDSDFVHILIHDVQEKDDSVLFNFENIAGFESDYTMYPISTLDSFKNPDMLIIKIGENVDGRKTVDSNFISHYDKLINWLDPNNKSVKIIVDGFWDNPGVNDKIKEYAIAHQYPFITTTDLSKDTTNEARGKFENKRVAIHPSDKGMRMIAERIWSYMKVYF